MFYKPGLGLCAWGAAAGEMCLQERLGQGGLVLGSCLDVVDLQAAPALGQFYFISL